MVKVISLSEEAYAELKKHKHGSFSDTVMELTKEKGEGSDYEAFAKLAGAFSDEKEEWEKIKKDIYAHRKKTKVRQWSF